MELRHLQTFAEAAERESFTRAAGALELTQAAVSQQVAALERQLGVRLFQRQGRGVQLTDQGRELYDYARQILQLVEEASRRVGRDRPPVSGILRIATSTAPAEWLLPELLAEFRERCPQVRESLAVSDSRLAAAAVAAGEADVGFVGERPAASPLAVQEIAEDELVLVVSREHPLAQKGTLTLKQLCREPLIVREPGSGTRGCVERALEAQGMAAADLTIVMEVNNNDAIRRAVERGVGMAFFSRGALRQARRLVPLKVRGLQLRRQLYVIRDRRRRLSPAADEFLQFLDQWRTHPASRRGTAAPRRRKTRAEPGRL